jgi:hypothetical protein
VVAAAILRHIERSAKIYKRKNIFKVANLLFPSFSLFFLYAHVFSAFVCWLFVFFCSTVCFFYFVGNTRRWCSWKSKWDESGMRVLKIWKCFYTLMLLLCKSKKFQSWYTFIILLSYTSTQPTSICEMLMNETSEGKHTMDQSHFTFVFAIIITFVFFCKECQMMICVLVSSSTMVMLHVFTL